MADEIPNGTAAGFWANAATLLNARFVGWICVSIIASWLAVCVGYCFGWCLPPIKEHSEAASLSFVVYVVRKGAVPASGNGAK